MAGKKVNISSKPKSQPEQIEDWVAIREIDSHEASEGENSDKTPPSSLKPKMKRLTLDVPEPLHRAIKLKAVQLGVPMADMLRELLSKHYGE